MQIEILTGAEAREAGYDKTVFGTKILWPDDSLVFYGREDGEIVGRTATIELAHIEGTEVVEGKRNTRTAARMIAAVEETVRTLGRSHVFAFALESQPEVSEYLERFGYKRFPAVVWCKSLREVVVQEVVEEAA